MTDDAVPGVDVTVPSPARMYDYYLGGKDNYAVDREAAEQVIEAHPQQRLLARNNRAFLTRAVWCVAGSVGTHWTSRACSPTRS